MNKFLIKLAMLTHTTHTHEYNTHTHTTHAHEHNTRSRTQHTLTNTEEAYETQKKLTKYRRSSRIQKELNKVS